MASKAVKRILEFALVGFIASLYSASSVVRNTAAELTWPAIAFVKEDLAGFSDRGSDPGGRVTDAVGDGKGNFLAAWTRRPRAGGTMRSSFRFSTDGGKTFGPETSGPAATPGGEPFESVKYSILQGRIAAVAIHKSDVYFYRWDKGGWTVPVQINDERGSVVGSVSVTGGSDEVFCAWVDRRRGFPLVFFSSSNDSGTSWSANKAIEIDFREGDQTDALLVTGAKGRLFAFWTDWRDRHTLADIRYSYTDDGGRHWVESRKVNDDGLHVWQVEFDVAIRGDRVFVVFSDFRDPGEDGDNDWNIYFTRSADNGRSFSENVRINDVAPGIDRSPKIAVCPDGGIYCLWRSGRNTIFGQAAISYSSDGGRTWGRSETLTGKESAVAPFKLILQPLDRNRVYSGWTLESYGSESSEHKVVRSTQDLAVETAEPDRERPPVPVGFVPGETVHSEDFSDGTGAWKAESGVWLPLRGSLMGVRSGSEERFAAFLDLREPESYVLRGRFKLDAVSHFIANIYFRTSESGLRHFVVGNQFRIGAWISEKDNDLPNGLHTIGGRVLTQRRYAFQRDRWYGFTLVVTPGQVDYYIDDALMLSSKGNFGAAPGRIGIGGYGHSPTYFDELSVSALKK